MLDVRFGHSAGPQHKHFIIIQHGSREKFSFSLFSLLEHLCMMKDIYVPLFNKKKVHNAVFMVKQINTPGRLTHGMHSRQF